MQRNVVINLKETFIIPVTSCSDKSYYGVLSLIGKRVGFISKVRKEDELETRGFYRVFCFHEITTGNSWPEYDREDIQTVLTNLCSNPSMRVYQFDTAKELANWIAENLT